MTGEQARRNLWLLVAGYSISSLGTWVLAAALPIWIYQLTGSATLLGLVVAVETLPALVVGPLAGVWVDRWDRRRVLVGANLLRAAVVLALLAVTDADRVWIIFVVGATNALIATFSTPAQQALLPRLVGDEALVRANAALTIGGTGAQMIGPALGGLLVTLAGPPATFLVDAASFVVMAVMIAALRLAPDQAPVAALERSAAQPLVQLREGAVVLTRHPMLRTLVGIWGLLMGAAGVVSAVLVVFVKDALGGSDALYGGLLSLQGAGLVAGGLAGMALGSRVEVVRLFQGGLLAFGLGFVALAASAMPFAAGIIVPVGVAMSLVGLTQMTMLQRYTPDAFRGRVLALNNSLSSLMVLVGAASAGVLADAFGVRPVFMGAALLCLLAGLLALVLLHPIPISPLPPTLVEEGEVPL